MSFVVMVGLWLTFAGVLAASPTTLDGTWRARRGLARSTTSGTEYALCLLLVERVVCSPAFPGGGARGLVE